MSFSLAAFDKDRLRRDLLRHLEIDLEMLVRRQRDTQAAATHSENRPEHSKDTRATEQGYLARGLATRVAEIKQTIDRVGSLELVRFGGLQPIALTALVMLQDHEDGRTRTCWLVPCAGGIALRQGDHALRTLTPRSPLGRALLGLRVGDEGAFPTPGGERGFEILSIA